MTNQMVRLPEKLCFLDYDFHPSEERKDCLLEMA